MLWERDTYIASVDCIIGRDIREWDISKANISILFSLGIIDRQTYESLYNADRQYRQIKVGLMQKNPRISKALSEGFIRARQIFCESNSIEDYNILAIKKDAIYLVDKIPTQTKFGDIEFKNKNIYTSFYRLNKLEFYYYLDYKNQEILDVKGISNNTLELHRRYMLDFLTYIFSLAQKNMLVDAINTLTNFTREYMNRELDSEYYRELDNRSMFRTRYIFDRNATYITGIQKIDDSIDIGYNLSILQELYKMLVRRLIV